MERRTIDGGSPRGESARRRRSRISTIVRLSCATRSRDRRASFDDVCCPVRRCRAPGARRARGAPIRGEAQGRVGHLHEASSLRAKVANLHMSLSRAWHSSHHRAWLEVTYSPLAPAPRTMTLDAPPEPRTPPAQGISHGSHPRRRATRPRRPSSAEQDVARRRGVVDRHRVVRLHAVPVPDDGHLARLLRRRHERYRMDAAGLRRHLPDAPRRRRVLRPCRRPHRAQARPSHLHGPHDVGDARDGLPADVRLHRAHGGLPDDRPARPHGVQRRRRVLGRHDVPRRGLRTAPPRLRHVAGLRGERDRWPAGGRPLGDYDVVLRR